MVSALGALVGCGGSEGAEVPVEESDTGSPTEDTGSTTLDTNTTPEDTNVTPEDTSTPPEDTGTPSDTGTPTDDGVDTAVAMDSGTTDTGTTMDTATSGCSSVAITTMGYTDTKVRQGAGAIQITATGTMFAGVTGASLLGAACTVVGTPTATSAVFSCNVPHGATLGAADLTITGGPTCTAAVTVEKITVAAATTGADDTTGLGTSTKPFRSVTKGLSVADTGDTVYIAANGMNAYTTTGTGESWLSTTTDNAYSTAANVKAGVTIEGDPAGGTRLSIGGTTTGSTTNSAFRFAGNATVRNLRLENFKWGVIASTGTITLTDVAIVGSNRDAIIANTGAGDTLAITASSATAGSGMTASKCLLSGNGVGVRSSGPGTTVTLNNCDVTTSRSTGAFVTNSGKVLTSATRFQSNGSAGGAGVPNGGSRPGLYVEGTSVLTMTGGEITTSYDYGLLGVGGSAITLTNVTTKSNGKATGSAFNSGIAVNAGTTAAKITLVGGEVSDSGYAGLNLGGNAEADVTGTSFAGNDFGIRIGSYAKFLAKGISITASTSQAIAITDGANNNTAGIAFQANGTTPTTISRAVASTLTALITDQRGAISSTSTMTTTVTFAAGTLFQGAVGAAATYTGVAVGGPTTYSNGGQLILSISGANRKIQLL